MSEIKVSKELFQKLTTCKTAQEVVDLCKAESIDLPIEDAEKFIAQLSSEEISLDSAEKIAGGEPCAGAVSFGCVGIGLF
ncbi:hypothetical protein [Butyrivibrio sp. AE2015]|uniref:hypothetical protein n=1 Tax=Butyrivibrio sp. AE2015 TaxID=1280663 RepID=UPI0003B61335|nr:hypothetical protein [Butyrivibrio sp. AE2015]